MKKKYSRVCIVGTIYSFLIYVLYSTMDEINDTLFVLGGGIKKEIKKRIPNHESIVVNGNVFSKIFNTIILRYRILYKYDLKNASYWGHDSQIYSGALLGNKKMTVIEDGFSCYYCYDQVFTFKHKITQFLTQSKIDETKVYGIGSHCNKILGTGIGEFKDGRKDKLEIVSIPEMWMKSSFEKRRYILSLFDITEAELSKYEDKDVILITQEAWQGKTTEDMIRMYTEMLRPYDKKRVVIKRHPREDLDYSIYFPGYDIITKPFPMELFSLVNVKFRVALTYNSTAIFSIPYDLERIIYDKSYIK